MKNKLLLIILVLTVLLVSCSNQSSVYSSTRPTTIPEAITPLSTEQTPTLEFVPTKIPLICPPDCWTLSSKSLHGADLHGAIFAKGDRRARLDFANLTEANLSEAYMSGVYFLRANLSGANLRGADLQEADLIGTNLSGADFSNANLQNADLRPVVEDTIMDGTILYGADLRGADLRGVYLNSALADADTRFDEKWQLVFDINGKGGNGLDLGATDLSDADLREANLQQASLRQADFRRSYLNGVNLQEADLYGANFNAANLSNANLNEAILKDANLTWTNLTGTDLSHADLSGADLRVASLNGAIFYQADLSNVNLIGADLTGANFDEADLSGAIVSEEQLSLAGSLTGATLPLSITSSIQITTELITSTLPHEIVTEQKAIDTDMRQRYGEVDASCGSCVDGGGNCSQYLWTKYVTRPEWDALFPNSHFYLVGVRQIQNGETNMYGYLLRHFIIVQQGNQRYELNSFDQLLDTNQVEITDENRELVTKTFVLMMLASYLEKGVVFSTLEDIDIQNGFEHYNYKLTAWTEIEGITIEFLFMIDQDNNLRSVTWYQLGSNTGAYIDAPPVRVFPTSTQEIYFR